MKYYLSPEVELIKLRSIATVDTITPSDDEGDLITPYGDDETASSDAVDA